LDTAFEKKHEKSSSASKKISNSNNIHLLDEIHLFMLLKYSEEIRKRS